MIDTRNKRCETVKNMKEIQQRIHISCWSARWNLCERKIMCYYKKKWIDVFQTTILHAYKLHWRYFREILIILRFWTFYYSVPIASVYSKTSNLPNDLSENFKEIKRKRNTEEVLHSMLWESEQQKYCHHFQCPGNPDFVTVTWTVSTVMPMLFTVTKCSTTWELNEFFHGLKLRFP
jgi:hypothetical protein